MAGLPSGLSAYFRKKREEETRLASQEKELVQAEGRQAGPFGNPNLTRKQQAPGGGGFAPTKGSVSEGAQSLFDEGMSEKRKKAKNLLAAQTARENAQFMKRKRPSSIMGTSRPSSVLSTVSSQPGGKAKLGV